MSAPITPAEGNRLLYADIADRYHRDLEGSKSKLRQQLDEALSLATRTDCVLDACGGSGNVSLELLGRGLSPTLVDVSPDMVRIYRRKAAELGAEPEGRVNTIEDFFAADGRSWDVILFSAARHDLDDYVGVVRAAYERLTPLGIIATVNDPTPAGQLGRKLRLLDYLASVAFREPGTLLTKAWYRAVARRRPHTVDPGYGRVAERHAVSGVDETRIVAAVEALGGEVINRAHDFGMNFRCAQAVARALGQPTGFSLVLCRPGP